MERRRNCFIAKKFDWRKQYCKNKPSSGKNRSFFIMFVMRRVEGACRGCAGSFLLFAARQLLFALRSALYALEIVFSFLSGRMMKVSEKMVYLLTILKPYSYE